MVNTMNENAHRENEDLLVYQTLRLKDLVEELVGCCDDRKHYESQKFGLPHSELECLMLFNGERYLTFKGIAQNLDVAKSRVTKIVDGLLRKGLVERIDDPRDARVKLLSLSASGEKLSEEIDAFNRGVHRELLLQLTMDERKSMLSHLELLRSAMEAVKETFV